jgi:VCBS repeat-containing protein
MPNLITDGGFDNGLTGWSVTAPNGVATTGAGSPAPGFQGFSNSSTGGDLTQTFATVAGAHYELTFSSFDNINSGSNALRVIVAGGATTIGLTQSFTVHVIDFVATSSSTTVDFNFTTVSGTGIIGIDNVDVELINHAPVLGVPASADAVVNGSFSAGGAAWTNAAGTGVEVNPAGVYGLDGSHGNVMEVDNNAGLPFDDISQTVATVAGQTYTFSFDTAQRAGFPGVTNSYEVLWNGQLLGTINPASTTFEHHAFTVTATGASGTIEFREVANSDGVGGIVDNVSLTSTTGAITEIAGVHGQSVFDTASLTLSLTDVDLSDTHHVTVAAPTVTWSGGATPAGLAGALAGAVQTSLADTTGTGAGSVRATFGAPDGTFDFLGKGETLRVTYNLTVTDAAGATSSQPITFVITGTNDAPIISGPGLAQVPEGAGAVHIDALARASDLDTNDHLSVVNVPTNLPPGVTFDAASHSFSLDPSNGAYQHLAQGAPQQVVVAYGVSDGTVTVPTQVIFTVIGQNDAPVVTGAVTGTTAEDGAVLQLNALANASDVDDGATLSVVGVPPLPPGLTFDAATRSFTLDPSNPAFQHLAAGEAQVLVVTYGVTDGIATTPASVRFTVTGTNDAPVVSGAVTGATAEDGPVLHLDALANASDVDDGTTLSVVGVPPLPPGLTYDPTTHSFVLDPSNAAFQHLAAGEAQVLTVTYGVTDGIATTPGSVSFTVTGTNDAPVVSGAVTGSATEDGAAVTLNGLANASDVDDNTTLSIVNLPVDLPAGVTYDVATHSFSLDASDAAYQSLGAGATQVVTVNYGVSDGSLTTAGAVSWTVTGVNDAPVAHADTASVDEKASVTIDVLGNDTDVDAGDTKTIVGVGATALGGVVTVVDGHLVYAATADTLSLLNLGQSAVDTFTYTMKDSQGALSTATVSVTVNGVADGADLIGGNHDQTLLGTALDEHITGGNGKDTLSGGGGADTLDGGNGTDSLSGGSGIDRLFGGNGADTLDGGPGSDSLTGGAGPDVFAFGAHFGHDVVTDFANEDTLSFAHGLFATFTDFMAHAHQVGNDVVITYDADDSIVLQHTTLSALGPSDVLLG